VSDFSYVMKRPTFLQVRILLLALGVGLAVGQAMLAWERGAPPTEVLAPVLYIPIFGGAILVGLTGGLIAAALSSMIYTLVLVDQSSSLGVKLFVGLGLSRVTTFFFYGLIVAMGTKFIERRLRKLEIYDQIDDETELYNGSFFLEDSDLEMSRSKRYQSIFSVAEVRMDRSLFEGASRRRYRRLMRELATTLKGGLRGVDRPARVQDDGGDRFLFILPETGKQGSEVVAHRLEDATRQLLERSRVTVNGHVSARAMTFPDDEGPLGELRREVAAVEAERKVIAETGTTR
jgi:GGDEF domain-containing protein